MRCSIENAPCGLFFASSPVATTIKVSLLFLAALASLVLYTIIFAIVLLTATGAKATGWPSLQHNLSYWLLMVLLLCGEIWLAAHKLKW